MNIKNITCSIKKINFEHLALQKAVETLGTNINLGFNLATDKPLLKVVLKFSTEKDKGPFYIELHGESVIEFESQFPPAEEIVEIILGIGVSSIYDLIRLTTGNITMAAGVTPFLGTEPTTILSQLQSSPEQREALLEDISNILKEL